MPYFGVATEGQPVPVFGWHTFKTGNFKNGKNGI